MKKGRKRAIHAELRKESKTFEGWLKYEVTIQNEDGKIEKIPAYGKDLQDALSRVVHDEKVEKLMPKINKIHPGVWAFIWFTLLGYTTTVLSQHSEELGDFVGLVYLGSIGILTTLTLALVNWFNLKNIAKPY